VAKPGEGAPARVLSSQSSIQCGSPDSSEPLNQGRDGPATLANPQSAICNPQSSDGSIPTGRDPAVPSSSGAGGEEFVIVQGVIDLAVVMPEEIWVLDFKTDHFAGADLEAKIRIYRPQLSLYAQAIARIYGRPVTRRWLHFFALSRTIQLDSTN
jgi:ATP-dependent exoDNAse (exonuclease V) beta subunit